jgi:hypothetical protein
MVREAATGDGSLVAIIVIPPLALFYSMLYIWKRVKEFSA